MFWCNIEKMPKNNDFIMLRFWVPEISLAGYLFTTAYDTGDPYTKSSDFS